MKTSLRIRIFLSMLFLVLAASILIAGVTIYQYSEEAKALHIDKLERKEKAIKSNIQFIFRKTYYPVDTESLNLIFKERIYEIQEIHNEEIDIYDLKGNLIKSSYASNFQQDTLKLQIKPEILSDLEESSDRRVVVDFKVDGQRHQSLYTYITDAYFKPIGILNIPYIEDDGFLDANLKEFFKLLLQVYLLMFLAAIAIAYLLSNYITKSLKLVGQRITQTKFNQRNEKIGTEKLSVELKPIINAYNKVIDELEESAVKLAKSEREQAWRQMARQVAHEIKNPLTPMRLSVQDFQRRFDPADAEAVSKLQEFTQKIIQQIDLLSSIASAFSSFASMPAQQNKLIDVSETIKLATGIFSEENIRVSIPKEKIYINFDKTQLIRVVTNLLKNAIQATSEKDEPKIVVQLSQDQDFVFLSISDNGIGIQEENQEKIFEPKFTTKTSGMGLGLGMVKNIVENYKGSISLHSKPNKGTTFTIQIPKK
ncbi:sensor histidine kinase [Psychroflexus planctonicus]|uniref:histidine kinase n=1 Tax=Psychroflexus planctonicus TaxID=1526575 RepID=A0ABQ1SCD5_9FLAO|nr:HAMP domain-containing sensor histidine kinase [Psychroflexus planctonicus]GGE26262.1 two-component sensor histidine kinase [Psychroflexus planctonicus]